MDMNRPSGHSAGPCADQPMRRKISLFPYFGHRTMLAKRTVKKQITLPEAVVVEEQ